MTIDDVIRKEKSLIEVDSLFDNVTGIKSNKTQYHEQISEFLEELKRLRKWKSDVMEEFCKYDCNSVEEVRYNAYDKAIDDFYKYFVQKIDWLREQNYDMYCAIGDDSRCTLDDLKKSYIVERRKE